MHYVVTYMIYPRTKVYIPNLCVSLVIAIRSKAKENLRTTVTLFFTVCKISTPTNIAYFPRINYCTQFRMQRLSDANVLASKVRASAVLFLLISVIEN
jgi:hypothetical protein